MVVSYPSPFDRLAVTVLYCLPWPSCRSSPFDDYMQIAIFAMVFGKAVHDDHRQYPLLAVVPSSLSLTNLHKTRKIYANEMLMEMGS